MNIVNFSRTALSLAAMVACAFPALAQDALSVDEIVKRTNEAAYYQGDDGRAQIKMTITDDQGRTREREFSILRKNVDEKNEEQKFYVYFRRPADVREMVFMVWKHVGADDDRWLYLPALDVVKRIAASDERTSFVGSNFYYEDVSGRGIDEDEHELVETTDTYYVLKNTPKEPDLVEFDSYTMYIHKGTFLPVKIEYEEGGSVYRVYEILQVEDIQGFKTVTKAKMSDLKSGGNTVNEYSNVEYNTGLPEDIFTERYLRRAPRQYLD
jgi:outer membrane lipoprotein-sorting protein